MENSFKSNQSKSRWNVLRNAVVHKKLIGVDINKQSKRANWFKLFQIKECCTATDHSTFDAQTHFCPSSEKKSSNDLHCPWILYTCLDIPIAKSVWIQQPKSATNMQV